MTNRDPRNHPPFSYPLVRTLNPQITPETEQVLPAAEMPGLRAEMNDALLELIYDDPLNAWGDIPVLELSGPLGT